MVAASFARIAGCRNPFASMAVPIRILSVATARAPSAAMGADLVPQVIRNHEAVVAEFLGPLSELDEPPGSAFLGVASPPAAKRNFRG